VGSGVRTSRGGSPTGSAESSSQYCYGLFIRLWLLSTLSVENAVTIDYGGVTTPRSGLSPDNSIAFTGALVVRSANETKTACAIGLRRGAIVVQRFDRGAIDDFAANLKLNSAPAPSF